MNGLVEQGAEMIVNVSASPWNLGKEGMRREMLASLAAKAQRPMVYCNAVGGNDELVFDGGSLALNAQGEVLAAGAQFAEALVEVDLDGPVQSVAEPDEMVLLHDALVLGVRDYLGKCGCSAVIGPMAVLIRQSRRHSQSGRLARRMCAASPCPRRIPRRAVSMTLRRSQRISALNTT